MTKVQTKKKKKRKKKKKVINTQQFPAASGPKSGLAGNLELISNLCF
jgi:hypothetical protein